MRITKRIHKWTVGIVGVLFVFFVVAYKIARPAQPMFQGAPLTHWLQEFNRCGGMDNAAEASSAIRAMGSNTLPLLTSILKQSDGFGWQRVLDLAKRLHLPVASYSNRESLTYPALLALNALGPMASPLIPELLDMFENPRTSNLGALGLYSIGPASIPAFEHACANSDSKVRIDAAIYLALLPIGYNADKEYYCHWYKRGSNSMLRVYVARPPGHDLVSELSVQAMRHTNAAVRAASIEALSGALPNRSNIPYIVAEALRKAKSDPDKGVRTALATTFSDLASRR